MPETFEPCLEVLPEAQQQIWQLLRFSSSLNFVLYGGTAVALYLGHRVSVDFDFFSSEPLDKHQLGAALDGLPNSDIVQEAKDTLVVRAAMPAGAVKLSFFGGLNCGRLAPPLLTADRVMLVASRQDLLATKLKAILDRAEAKDYRDIAALLASGESLPRSLAGFSKMFGRDPALPLRAIGFFEDGDLATVPEADRRVLRAARDAVSDIPEIALISGPLVAD